MGVFEKKGRSQVPVLHLMVEEYPLYVASPEILLRSATRVNQIGDGRRYLWIAPDECGRAHCVQEHWVTVDDEAKHRLFEILCLNLLLDGVNRILELRKPFDVLAKGLVLEKSRGDRIRTCDLLNPIQAR